MKFRNCILKYRVIPLACSLSCVAAFPVYASEVSSAGTIQDMLQIFSELFKWILAEGATLLTWMLDKPILMISMGLFFCGAIIAFLMRIYHSV